MLILIYAFVYPYRGFIFIPNTSRWWVNNDLYRAAFSCGAFYLACNILIWQILFTAGISILAFVYFSVKKYMKLLIICIIALFAQPKPPTFAQKFAAFDQKLYDHAVATGTSGDTAATKTALLLAANDLSGYNVSDELAKIPPAQQGCRWACTGQFYYYCINLAGSTHEAHLCMIEYINCVRTCGYIPF